MASVSLWLLWGSLSNGKVLLKLHMYIYAMTTYIIDIFSWIVNSTIPYEVSLDSLNIVLPAFLLLLYLPLSLLPN